MTKSVLKHKVTFDEFCTKHTKVLCKLLRKDHEIYKNWLDFMVNEYTGLARDEQYFERIENSTIIALLTESIDCLDGVSILHRQGAVNPAYPLIRKLMELNFQIKFLLQSDTPNRALAFEAYYVSRKTKGEDNTQNIYLQFAKYSEYKKEADKIFEENYKGNYPEWYGVYDKVEKQSCSQRQQKSFINSIKKLCKEIGDNEIYNKIYNLISKNITMTILNQRFYAEQDKDNENNHSVCTLFTHGDKNFLFTGDLDKEGEESLVSLNNLPKCELYKAGHHGSKTSSNEVLLEKIQPNICCVCCCAGNVEYTQNLNNTFPTQDFINRISKYTDRVYVTTLGPIVYTGEKNKDGSDKYQKDGHRSLNGNIVVTSTSSTTEVNCSNNNIKLKDTDWFKKYRKCPTKWVA